MAEDYEVSKDESGNYTATYTPESSETETLTEAQIDDSLTKLQANIDLNQIEITRLQALKDRISVVKTVDEEVKAAEALATEETATAAEVESAEKSLPVEE